MMAQPQNVNFLCGFTNLLTQQLICFIPVRAADGPADALQLRDFLIHCLAVDKNASSVQQRESTSDADTENPTETSESSQ